MKIGIIGAVILIVLVSGCTSYSTTKTFSDGVMSFDYPDDFNNVTYSDNYTNSSFIMQVTAYFENTAPLRVHNIMVLKNVSATSPTEIRDKTISSVKNESTGEILSLTTETNPNCVVVEKSTYSFEYASGMRSRYSEMYFKINDVVYGISVYGPDTKTSTQNIINTTNVIFQSIK
jgi:hypothetical protein